MSKQILLASLFLSFSFFLASPVVAKRIALVIGNDDYANVSKLKKAVNDATAIASTLEDTGFQVLLEKNANRQAMSGLLGKLSAKIEAGDEVLFYFSGHGVAVRGENYLLPIDIPQIVPSLEHSITKEAFSEDEVISLIKERGAKVTVMIIDACRNNPFPKKGTRAVGRSVGLARTGAPAEGTFIMYSAGIGQEALDRLSDDDKNPNSIFTRKLLPLLKTPGLDITQMTKGLRLEVRDLALTAAAPNKNHNQFPAYYDQMEGNFYFVPGSPDKTNKVSKQQNSADETLWATIENSKKASDFEFYLSEHPKGRYSSVAKLRIQQLNRLAMITPLQKTSANEKFKIIPFSASFYSRRNSVIVREGPDKTFAGLSTLKEDQNITIVGKTKIKDTTWYQIKLSEGSLGYAPENAIFSKVQYDRKYSLLNYKKKVLRIYKQAKDENDGKFKRYFGIWGINSHACEDYEFGPNKFLFWFSGKTVKRVFFNEPFEIHSSKLKYYRKFKAKGRAYHFYKMPEAPFKWSNTDTDIIAFFNNAIKYNVRFTKKQVKFRGLDKCNTPDNFIDTFTKTFDQDIAKLTAEKPVKKNED